MLLTRDSREFIESLNSHGVEYVIVGAYAIAFHGRPRFTDDIDLLVGTSSENAARVVAALVAFGFGSLGLSQSDFEQPHQVVQLGHPPNRIDLLTSLTGIDTAEALRTKVAATFDGVPVFVLDRELLKRNKAATGRDQDRADLRLLDG